MGNKYKKGWSEDEDVEVCEAIPEPKCEDIAVPTSIEEKEEEHCVKEEKPDVTSYVTKIAHRGAVQFQVLESTVKGTHYVVVPLIYFNMKPEEIVLLDDCALIPFLKQE